MNMGILKYTQSDYTACQKNGERTLPGMVLTMMHQQNLRGCGKDLASGYPGEIDQSLHPK